MDLLNDYIALFKDATSFEKSTNFYFEKHLCDVQKEEIKVQFDYNLSKENCGDSIILGQCPHCKKVFYNIEMKKRKKKMFG